MGLCFLWLYVGEHPRLDRQCSGFKASQKTGPRVSPDRLGELGKKLGTPGYKASDIQYTLANECHAFGLPYSMMNQVDIKVNQ